MLLVGREDVDDPVHRLRRVLGVEGAEDEVAGLGGGHGERDGLQVAHLTDEYDVRVLPENVLEGLGEALGVLVDLALVDDALLVLVQELYGILDAHDVLASGLVDPVDHRRERGRLTAARRSRHQYQTPWLLRHVLDGLGQTELVEAFYLVRYRAERRTERAFLEVHVDPEAGGARQGIAEVELPVVLQALALVVREDVVDQLAGHVGGKRWVVERLDLALHAHHRRQPDRYVQVARAQPDRVEEIIVEPGLYHSPSISRCLEGACPPTPPFLELPL